MCGIAAIYVKKAIKSDKVKAMINIIKHRGPDGEGYQELFDGCLWLGHRRLAIVDLSETASQPMSYNQERYWITFNGEIYNHIELREELVKYGFKFKSLSDTEVILAAYAQWGEDCLQHFNGMWAFVITDVVEKKLFAARDRFGVKPLYYAVKNQSIGFSSEIKQLRAVGFGTGRASRNEVAKFLLYGELNFAKETFFQRHQ